MNAFGQLTFSPSPKDTPQHNPAKATYGKNCVEEAAESWWWDDNDHSFAQPDPATSEVFISPIINNKSSEVTVENIKSTCVGGPTLCAVVTEFDLCSDDISAPNHPDYIQVDGLYMSFPDNFLPQTSTHGWISEARPMAIVSYPGYAGRIWASGLEFRNRNNLTFLHKFYIDTYKKSKNGNICTVTVTLLYASNNKHGSLVYDFAKTIAEPNVRTVMGHTGLGTINVDGVPMGTHGQGVAWYDETSILAMAVSMVPVADWYFPATLTASQSMTNLFASKSFRQFAEKPLTEVREVSFRYSAEDDDICHFDSACVMKLTPGIPGSEKLLQSEYQADAAQMRVVRLLY